MFPTLGPLVLVPHFLERLEGHVQWLVDGGVAGYSRHHAHHDVLAEVVVRPLCADDLVNVLEHCQRVPALLPYQAQRHGHLRA